MIIPNEQGTRTTPSYVSFSDEGVLTGDTAKVRAPMNPRNTIFDAKRFIGRRYDEKFVQSDKKLLPYEIVADSDGSSQAAVQFEVSYKGEIRRFSPEEISSFLLRTLKTDAERYLGLNPNSITNAVITVPAYFNDNQRQATKDAAKIAGLNVLQIINEPTAAALAYGRNPATENNKTGGATATSATPSLSSSKNILVFDLGGGTFDVSLLTLSGSGRYEVRATAGDTHLGGEDFDELMVKECIRRFQFEYPSSNILENQTAIRRLRTMCEKTKRKLSEQNECQLSIENLMDGYNLSFLFTRELFESLNKDRFDACLIPVRQVLKDAKMKKEEIDEIVLIGGSTRIPAVKSLLSNFFNGKKLNDSINPDEAVAYGASLQAAILYNNIVPCSISARECTLIDVAPLSLGVNALGEMMKLIERNTVIPCEKTRLFTTISDNQTHVQIDIYEGERALVTDNNKLGEFFLTQLPAAPKGALKIEVTFSLDINGILSVSARESLSGQYQQVLINHQRGRLSSEQIASMIDDAEKNRKLDEQLLQRTKAKIQLEGSVYLLKKYLNNPLYSDNKYCSIIERESLLQKITEIEYFQSEIELERQANVCNRLASEFIHHQQQLELLAESFLKNIHKESSDEESEDVNIFLKEAFAQYEHAVNVAGFHSYNAV